MLLLHAYSIYNVYIICANFISILVWVILINLVKLK